MQENWKDTVQDLSWNGLMLVIAYGKAKIRKEFDFSKVPAKIFTDCAAARHGIEQKYGDAKSGDKFGKEKAEYVDRIYAANVEGNWNIKGDAGDAYIEQAYQILAESAKQKPEQAKVWYADYLKFSEEKKAEVRAKGFMKAAIEKARADKKLQMPESSKEKPFNPNE